MASEVWFRFHFADGVKWPGHSGLKGRERKSPDSGLENRFCFPTRKELEAFQESAGAEAEVQVKGDKSGFQFPHQSLRSDLVKCHRLDFPRTGPR